MTDNEIVKALECCTGKPDEGLDCSVCPFMNTDNCMRNEELALDLIIRQKAEKDKAWELFKKRTDEKIELQMLCDKQKAEIERLNNLKMFEKFIDERIHTDKVRGLSWEFKTKEDRNKAFEKELEKLFDIATAKAEAIKEFAERLKGRIAYECGQYATDEIDNLVKEMVGDSQ